MLLDGHCVNGLNIIHRANITLFILVVIDRMWRRVCMGGADFLLCLVGPCGRATATGWTVHGHWVFREPLSLSIAIIWTNTRSSTFGGPMERRDRDGFEIIQEIEGMV